MKISYVIPICNKAAETANLTKLAIDSIHKHTLGDYEIILIDNASPWHAHLTNSDVRREIYQDAKVIAVPTNVGFGAACNLGFRLSQGEYVVCMNSDAELVEDSANILIEFMQKNNIRVAFPEHYETCKHYNMDKGEEIMWQWYFGAFWVSKRAFICEMHGFDEESFPMCYYEDTDLWSRVIKTGHRIAGYRGTWVKHLGGASSIENMDSFFTKNKETYVRIWGTDKVISHNFS